MKKILVGLLVLTSAITFASEGIIQHQLLSPGQYTTVGTFTTQDGELTLFTFDDIGCVKCDLWSHECTKLEIDQSSLVGGVENKIEVTKLKVGESMFSEKTGELVVCEEETNKAE